MLWAGDKSIFNRNCEPSGNKDESSAEVTTTINRHAAACHLLQRSRASGENGTC